MNREPDRASLTSPRVAVIGECLIELNGAPFAALHQTFGGDSLNTALYLARLAQNEIEVHYVTAMGTDPISEEIVRRWQAEGIDTAWVLRDPLRLPEREGNPAVVRQESRAVDFYVHFLGSGTS